MKKKLRNSRGVSVLEMLVAVLLLSLLTAGGVTATAAVMADYNHMGEAANAETLASTVIEAISNEIRLGKDITVSDFIDPTVAPAPGTSLHLDVSAFFGEDVTLKLDGNDGSNTGRLVAEKDDGTGTPAAVSQKQILSEDTYSGLYLRDLEFEIVPASPTPPAGGTGTTEKTVFKISFIVCSDYSDELWKGWVYAAPMFE